MSAVIELRGVVREYPGEPPVTALDGIDLAIERGELAAIVGRSGSGKSTLLNVMGTLDRPTAGSVLIDGVDTAGLRQRHLCGLRATRLGFVFQSFHLLENMSAESNVAAGLLYQGVPVADRRRRARRALDMVGLGDRATTKPAKLSGGQRQRVAIARALVSEPALVLADEPTGNLDTSTGDEILALFFELNREHGVTVAIITHDGAVAERAPRCITLSDGRVVSDRLVTEMAS